MEIVSLIARAFLASVLGIAGIGKAADQEGTRRAIVAFGLPEKIAGPAARILAATEIAIASALIVAARPGSKAALALLSIFSVAVVVNLAGGRTPDCRCFGQFGSKPISWRTLARNLALMAIASFIVARPGPNPLDWIASLNAAEISNLTFGLISAALLAAAVFYMRRLTIQQSALIEGFKEVKKLLEEDYGIAPFEHDRAAPPEEGLPIGAKAPHFSLIDINGQETTLSNLLLEHKHLLLLFVSPRCPPCKNLLPVARKWELDRADLLTVAVISSGNQEEIRKNLTSYEFRHLLLAEDSELSDLYGAKWTPTAVLIGPNGRITSEAKYGDQAIRDLVERFFAQADAEWIKGNGAKQAKALSDLAMPSFALTDARGNTISDQDLIGQETLLLFWNPKCPYCQQMASDLQRWEESPPEGAPRLVLISSGELEDFLVESAKFKSLLLHDKDMEVGSKFGTNATPSAVLIDSDGRIASPLTVGRLKILPLLGIYKIEPQAQTVT